MRHPRDTRAPHRLRYVAVTAILTIAASLAAIALSGCAPQVGGDSAALPVSGPSTEASLPAPPLDSHAPRGLETAVFGLG